MTPRKLCSVVIPDADVIISLHAIGRWEAVLNGYRVFVAKTVIEEADHFYNMRTTNPSIGTIEIRSQIATGKLDEFEVLASTSALLFAEGAKYGAPIIHDGEFECIAGVFTNTVPEARICLIDEAAIRYASLVGLRKDCISVEALLDSCGVNERVEYRLSERRFAKIADVANQERLDRLLRS
ncbi:hypothetical protein C3F09_07940 [candidate division GN15 bacterium]|uniref:Nucleic acid-binding protein n=1 Tax=candidate division GN15 bacterium TaxID=2072418 RepID=A0A855X5S3_9BACT|nr:MAG: hypothetical protein C3F09_07940 [candidate division GN15 bacterium]